ncbi:MAG: helix-turn-helix transcriptional regulator [Pseudomonadota bacterium]
MERPPCPALSGLVRSVWHSTPTDPPAPAPSHELMMPSGEMHLVLRLAGPPIAVFDHLDDHVPRNLGYAVVNGARAAAYAKRVTAGSSSIGLQLRPGASQALLGLPADELAGRHVQLEDLWGADAGLLREQLLAAPSADDKLRCLEAALMQRLPSSAGSPARSAHPAVLAGLRQLHDGSSVDAAARSSGYSQRQFVRLFLQAVGLTPRRYVRLQRFQKALRLMQQQEPSLADVAFASGYSDQPHFNRDFRAFAGLRPEQYRAARPIAANHVPVSFAAGGDVRFVQDSRRPST